MTSLVPRLQINTLSESNGFSNITFQSFTHRNKNVCSYGLLEWIKRQLKQRCSSSWGLPRKDEQNQWKVDGKLQTCLAMWSSFSWNSRAYQGKQCTTNHGFSPYIPSVCHCEWLRGRYPGNQNSHAVKVHRTRNDSICRVLVMQTQGPKSSLLFPELV